MANPIKHIGKLFTEVWENYSYIWLASKCKDISYEAFSEMLLDEHKKIANGQPTTKKGEFSENFREENNALVVDRLKIKLAEEEIRNDVKKAYDVKVAELYLCSNEGKDIGSRDIPIHFKKCIFSGTSGNTRTSPEYIPELRLYKSEAHQVGFDGCVFTDASLRAVQYTDGNKRVSRDPAFHCLYIKDSTFTAEHAYILIDARLPVIRVKFRESPSSGEFMQDTGTGKVHIENCKGIAFMRINTTNLTMGDGNNIGLLEYTIPESKLVRGHDCKPSKQKLLEIPDIYNIHWSPYQNIFPDWFSVDKYKELMIKMKELAEKSNDALQVATFNREILKCDHRIIRMKKPRHSFQDRATLWINQHVSNYGVSWVRPLALLLATNSSLALIVSSMFECSASGHYGSFVHVFSETMSPLTRIDDLYARQIQDDACTVGPGWLLWLLSWLDATHKLVYALCAYEIVRVGRRFTRMSS